MASEHKKRRGFFPAVLRALLITTGVAVVAVCVFFAYLYFTQDRMVFIRQPLGPGASERTRGTQPLAITTPDGVTLRGWLLAGKGKGRRPLLLYFGGNAEEVSYTIPYTAPYARAGLSVALVNYRGYGESGGKPSEAALNRDAALIYDTLTKRQDIDAGRVAVMGRSLGTGVAVHLASVRKVAGVVLVSPYDSLVAVAREHDPYVPVGLLLRTRFDSASIAPDITAPLLMITGTADTVIPPARSKALAARWGGPVQTITVAGAGHENLPQTPGYARSIADFLRSLP